jgi:chloramphenicol 3-O phosphotransferase
VTAPVRVVVLNGGSSAGKSTIARCLQGLLPEPFLIFGVDNLMEAMPPALWGSPSGIEVSPDGHISVGPAVRALEVAWRSGIAAMAKAGAGLILDLVMLDGAAAQNRWRDVLRGESVFWVAVKCDPEVASAREAARGDRIAGTAAAQAMSVHRGVAYDFEVDTTTTAAKACARAIADRLAAPT